jgi:hypothetical protein
MFTVLRQRNKPTSTQHIYTYQMTTSIKLERGLQTNHGRNIGGTRGGIQLFQGRIQVSNVSRMMFRMMNRHGFGRNGG